MSHHSLDTPETGFSAGTEAFRARVAKRLADLRAGLDGLLPVPNPSILELGAGHGHFLTAYAAAHPDSFCLGLDLITDRVRRANKKRDRAGLENLAFLRCEAMEFLHCLPPDTQFDRIFVLFPDPWPKKRHHKNRLLSSTFLQAMAQKSRAGAQLFFRTDHRPYYDEVRETVANHDAWKLTEEPPWPFEETTVFQQRAESYSSLMATHSICPLFASKEVHPDHQENLDR